MFYTKRLLCFWEINFAWRRPTFVLSWFPGFFLFFIFYFFLLQRLQGAEGEIFFNEMLLSTCVVALWLDRFNNFNTRTVFHVHVCDWYNYQGALAEIPLYTFDNEFNGCHLYNNQHLNDL